MMEIMKLKRERKILYHKCGLRELSGSIKYNNICITGIPEEEKEKGAESLFEQILANLGMETDIKI